MSDHVKHRFFSQTIAFWTCHLVARYVRSLPRGTVEILEYVFTLLSRFTGRNAFLALTRNTPWVYYRCVSTQSTDEKNLDCSHETRNQREHMNFSCPTREWAKWASPWRLTGAKNRYTYFEKRLWRFCSKFQQSVCRSVHPSLNLAHAYSTFIPTYSDTDTVWKQCCPIGLFY